MAWKARLAEDISVTPDLMFQVFVTYYDDADPANANVSGTVPPTNVLHTKRWFFPWGITTAELQARVVAEGQQARIAQQRVAAARAAVPNGTIVPIP